MNNKVNNEVFPLFLKTFQTIWGVTQPCADSDKTFDVVKLGNMLRSRKYYLMDKKILSSNCFSDNYCSLDKKLNCNIFDFLDKGNGSLKLKAYVEKVNDTIFRTVNSYDNTRFFGSEYKIFSPQQTPLLYEHKCFTDESMLIKNVHKVVLQGHDISMRTPKTGKCGIFLIEDMSDKLKQLVQEVTLDVVNKTTSSMIDFFSTTVTEQTSLGYTNNYGMIDYNSTNSTAINRADEQHSQDNTMLVSVVLVSAVTFTASMTYLLTRMYNKYCKKAPIAQLETPDTNISDPNLMEINGKKAKIYYSDSSSADGQEYAIVDISSKKTKYTKATYDTSNPSTSHSEDYERMELMNSSDDSTQDNLNETSYNLASSSANKTDYMKMFSKKETDKKSTHDTSNDSTSHSHIYETIDEITDQGYVNTYSLAKLHQEEKQHIKRPVKAPLQISIDIEDKDSGIPIYDDCDPYYDRPPLPRPVTVIENKNFNIPVEQDHDATLLGLNEFQC